MKEDENYNCIVDKPLFILVLFIKCISFKYTRKLKNSNEITISFDGGKIMDLKNIVALNLVELTGIYGAVSYTHLDVYKRQAYLQLEKLQPLYG